MLKFLSGNMLAASLALFAPVASALDASFPEPAQDFGDEWLDAYPAIGKSVAVNYGSTAWRLVFDKDGRTMTFTGTAGDVEGYTDTVRYTAVRLRPRLYLVYWYEPRADIHVVQVQDFTAGVLHSDIIDPPKPPIRLMGSLTIER